METHHTGTIVTWKDDKGFGFITPDQGGQHVFFHISDLSGTHTRPAEQMKVAYTLSYDERQRPRATMVRFSQIRTAFPILSLLVMSMFFLGLILATYVLHFLVWVLVGYILVSLITFFTYGSDKERAMRGEQRVPEARLHLLEFLGGWPGAMVAQSYYRHKTVKASFQSTFWGIVIFHLFVLIGYAFVQYKQ